MSAGDDWAPGDLALCVNAGAIRSPSGRLCVILSALRRGAVYTVGVVVVSRLTETTDLVLREVRTNSDTGGFIASRFIKVTPPEADEFDRETIELMRGKPAKGPRHA